MREGVLARVVDLEEKLGKLSPFNLLDALKAFATKTQGAVDLIVWTLDAIKDLLVTELANHQDFKGVQQQGPHGCHYLQAAASSQLPVPDLA